MIHRRDTEDTEKKNSNNELYGAPSFSLSLRERVAVRANCGQRSCSNLPASSFTHSNFEFDSSFGFRHSSFLLRALRASVVIHEFSASTDPNPASTMAFFSKTLDKLKGALRKTGEVLNTDVRTLFVPGRQIDDEFLTELEEKFLQADMGVNNVERIVTEIRDRWRLGKIKNADDAEGVVREQMLAGWPPGRPRTELRPRRPDRHPGRRHQRRRQNHQHRQARLAAEKRR